MNQNSDIQQRMRIVTLTWPIFIEVLLRAALNTTDIFMLGHYSDLAVSAVGVVSQIMFFLLIICMMVSSGTGILIAQYNGASDYHKSAQVGVASILLAVLVGSLLSFSVFISSYQVVGLFDLDAQVAQFGYDYLVITGACTFNLAISIVLTTILRSHGYSRSPMMINLIAGVINVVGNYMALYQPFGLPVYGVTGVAVATVVSQFFVTAVLIVICAQSKVSLPFSKWKSIPSFVYKQILKIGGMNAGEVLSYNLAQIAITYIVVRLGTHSLAAFTYTQNITRVAFAFSLALGQGAQIQTSYYVGKGWVEDIFKRVTTYYLVGLSVTMGIIGVIFIMRYSIIGLFTDNLEIIAMVASLLLGAFFVESGRCANLIFIAALKGAGDIKFPVQIGILSMWGLSVVFSYLLGIHWVYGVLGVWVALGIDEWVRGVVMILRWRSKRWAQFVFTGNNEQDQVAIKSS
ncbi:MATE family efflux transporter [Vibrio sp. CK2-1]|uniref:MATE family efflux transporter n=1 Tax=Vibrio sp. CK2-1 TaxID=2912249 RepID=UPI001F3BD58A|nr:MATE family efflux transporter [Vibrio sp. CK2-1]MCF7352951.1 MATE family efflux transporter [Vibrio sp. CK2-1]